MKRYLFSDKIPQNEDNLKFKKRATMPSSCYVLGRVIYNNGVFFGIESIGNVKDVSGISRNMEVEAIDNGISFSSLPKRSSSSPVTLYCDGGSSILEEWYNRVESRNYQYLCDVVLLILDSSYSRYSRCYGFKDAWVSNLTTSDMGTDRKEDIWGVSFVLQHCGVKSIDLGDKIEFIRLINKDGTYSVDNSHTKLYTKASNFVCDKVTDTEFNHTMFTHFLTI